VRSRLSTQVRRSRPSVGRRFVSWELPDNVRGPVPGGAAVNGLFEQIARAEAAVRRRWPPAAKVGLILGTGLGNVASLIEREAVIPYSEIPHFPISTAPSHAGQLVCGRLGGVALAALEGRFHYYEGYSLREVTFPVHLLKGLGAEILILTNAAGGMNPQYELADLVLIEDHISLMPDNPLRGINDDRLGPRFPDMLEPYDRKLSALAHRVAMELQIPIRKGVLVAVPGPNLETRAEYRMLRAMGADVVSMSTVPEAIVAVHTGLRTLAISIVTDMCLPASLGAASLERILEVAARGGQHLERLIPAILSRLAAEGAVVSAKATGNAAEGTGNREQGTADKTR
jgi:purine-nucleoside phosphorylase